MMKATFSFQRLSVPIQWLFSGSVRHKHSNRQVNRLFNKNPYRTRRLAKVGYEPKESPKLVPEFPKVFDAQILTNGWSMPPPLANVPNYPFRVPRTKNKPKGAIGFLPVYSKFRKDGTKSTTLIKRVSGDTDAFLHELKAALDLPERTQAGRNSIRIRAGGTIEVEGHRSRDVKQWLVGLGF